MKEFFDWLIRSSADPEKVGLAVKGFLIGLVPVTTSVIIPTLCSMVAVCIDPDVVMPGINQVKITVEAILGIVATVVFFLGLGRKVKLGRWSAK